MAIETELERRLHDELHARASTDPLPERVLTDSLALGHRALRRRRRAGVLAAAASLVVVSGLVALGTQGRGDPPSPAPSPPTATPTPGVAPVAWANGLPLGAPPEVPYLAGTAVVLPDGTRVETGGSGAGVIGLTVAGLVVLVETETEDPYSFSSRYVLVTDSGEVRDLPVSSLTMESAQEAVVSPDGTRLTSGAEILDVRDLSITWQVPEAADILLAWTPAGILYSVGDYGPGPARYFLLPSDSEPRRLPGNPGVFPNGTDTGMAGCRVVRMDASGATTLLSDCIDGLRSVSPSGRWALTDDLRLVDVASGETRDLAGDPVQPTPDAFDKVWWDGDSSLLFPVGALLVRCDTSTGTCERASDGHELRDGVLALP